MTPVPTTDEERYYIRLFQGGIFITYVAMAAGIWQAAIHKVHLAWQGRGPVAVTPPSALVPMALKVTGVGLAAALVFYAVAFWHLRRVSPDWSRVRLVRAYASRSTIAVALASLPLVVQAVAYRGGYLEALGYASAGCLAVIVVTFPRVRGLGRFLGHRVEWLRAQQNK